MSADTLNDLRASVELLNRAATALRKPVDMSGLDGALANWLEAEAKHASETYSKHAAINVLLVLSDDRDQYPLRISVGYNTTAEAVAVARQILAEVTP